ncbi:MAG TPA: HEAT repeat domain-containing protein [Herpetosiphonaceae bacterium]
MFLLKRLFALPPDTFELKQRHDVPGLIAALGHRFPWIRRDAAQILGQMQEPQVRAPLTAALNDRDSEVRHAVQDALDTLNAPAPPPNSVAV